VFKISHYSVQISLWYIVIEKNVSRDCKIVGFCQSWYFLMLNSTKALAGTSSHIDKSMNSISLFLWNKTTCDQLKNTQLFVILNALFLITCVTQNFSQSMSEWFQNFPRTSCMNILEVSSCIHTDLWEPHARKFYKPSDVAF